jgi:regulator of replication initiation timing
MTPERFDELKAMVAYLMRLPEEGMDLRAEMDELITEFERLRAERDDLARRLEFLQTGHRETEK